MYEIKIHEIPEDISANAIINKQTYESMYQESLNSTDTFWKKQAEKFITWFKPWKKISSWNFNTAEIAWFEGAQLNVSYNCIDRHLVTRADQIALIWESDDPGIDKKVTYRELSLEVNRFANVLKNLGVKKGDRVCIYMPMILEAVYAMLACTRIGAIHSVVFGGFSPESLKDRILDSDCQIVITADEGVRGKKIIHLKNNVDEALKHCPNVRHCLVIKHTGGSIQWQSRDVWYHDALANAGDECAPEIMDAEDPLFILYTSGSTGKPKGVLHTTGGYLLYTAMTHKYVFDYQEGEIFWCTADVGWVTGHSYIVYGPLCNGATTLVFEGIPSYPSSSRFWEVCDKHSVNIFYTAPTAIRALMRDGDEPVKKTRRKTLRILGTVGEPINPEVWEWYYNVVGDGRCPIVDTWWQTETGGHLITPMPGAIALKPGSATKPFFGIEPVILNDKGQELEGECEGILAIKQSWPGQMRGVYGNQQRFLETYFKPFPGYFFTGDGAKRDKDGYYWITGRVDDVINVSGHRLGTAEVESALVMHDQVAEAAVVGYPHPIKGQGIYAFVTLKKSAQPSDTLKSELIQVVRKEIGHIANVDIIQWAPALPKTRSGKIMRRILRKIAANDISDLGDTTTLADPSVVDDLKNNRITIN